jgi:hypothetical protein
MEVEQDQSTPDQPGEVLAVTTLDGPAVLQAPRYIHVGFGAMIQLHVLGSTDIEFGTDGHGLGVVRYRKVRQVEDQVHLYERVSS